MFKLMEYLQAVQKDLVISQNIDSILILKDEIVITFVNDDTEYEVRDSNELSKLLSAKRTLASLTRK